MKVEHISIMAAIQDFVEDHDLDETEIDEELLKKWALTVINLIKTDQQLVQKVALLDVRNYKVKSPIDFEMVCEVSYRLDKPDDCPSNQQQISQWVQGTEEGCELEINIVCPKCHKTGCTECGQNEVVVDVDRIWEQSNAYLNHITKYSRVSRFGQGTSTHTPEFRLLSYAKSGYEGISRHFPNCMNLKEQCEHSYSLNLPNIELSFEKGEILLSYLAKQLDENGDLMIPNHELVFEAIVDYLTYKWHRKVYFRSREVKDYRAYKDAQAMSDISIGRARSALQIPGFQEFTAWLKNNKYYKIDNAYDNLMNHGVPLHFDRFRGRNTYKG